MYKKPACKIAILMKFYYELYSDEGLSLDFEALYCIYLTHEQLHIVLPESFFEPITIHRTQYFVQKFNFVIKDGRQNTTFKHSNKWISGATVTEFAVVFQTNESLLCMSHRICSCLSNKQVFIVTVTELDFVFYNKTVKDISKNIKNKLTLKNYFALLSSLYSYF